MGCNKYRIGVFFDGTGNNKFIEAERGKGGATNIAKLYELYEELKGEECGTKKCYSDKIYIEGIGTHTELKNGTRVKDRHAWDEKLEKGAGGGGGDRIDDAIKKLIALLKSHPYGKGGPNKFCERTIDVFGFSRGAAQARDFINTFYADRYPQNKDIKFGFVGIYDTVGSFGSAGDNINMKPNDPSRFSEMDGLSFANHKDTVDPRAVKYLTHFTDYGEAKVFAAQEQAKRGEGWLIKVDPMEDVFAVTAVKKADQKAFSPYNFDLADGSAQRIFHIVSNDEVRKNFPLSSLLSIGGKHNEAGFPGVHADVGGGYDDEVTEPHSYSPDKVYYSKPKALAAAKSMEASLSKGWKVRVRVLDSSSEFLGTTYGLKCTLQRNLPNSISRVTLHHMYYDAACFLVPLKPMPNDEAHQIPPEMVDYYKLYNANKSIFTKSNSHDVKKFGELTKDVDWEEIDNYRHHSSVDPKEASTHYDGDTLISHIFTKDSPDMIGGNNARYVNGKVEREIYKNKASNAIVPKNV